MRRRLLILPLLVLALVGFAAASSGCGDEPTAEAKEGEPLELGDVEYSIQITRELNRFSPEDASYLEGAPRLRHGEEYLGVFMQVSNNGEEAAVVPDPFKIVDTRGRVYDQVFTWPKERSSAALRPGTPVLPDETVPGPETAARNGPIEGSLVLFAIDEAANENRPLVLHVPGPDGVGEIVLDL